VAVVRGDAVPEQGRHQLKRLLFLQQRPLPLRICGETGLQRAFRSAQNHLRTNVQSIYGQGSPALYFPHFYSILLLIGITEVVLEARWPGVELSAAGSACE
jgi:hypothetical protein